ncbi:hypothetical protein [Streptomyces sp. NPDC051840]|uniref:hypothetical protein n=1 Tax=unclassified Streptomyces TaxID=2593676 RepID=UPI00344808D7
MVVWILWAILMVGAGLATAIFCTLLLAPGAVFYLVSSTQAKRRARSCEVDVTTVSIAQGDEMPSSRH